MRHYIHLNRINVVLTKQPVKLSIEESCCDGVDEEMSGEILVSLV